MGGASGWVAGGTGSLGALAIWFWGLQLQPPGSLPPNFHVWLSHQLTFIYYTSISVTNFFMTLKLTHIKKFFSLQTQKLLVPIFLNYMYEYLPTPRLQKSGDIWKSLHCENVQE